ncbi:MAG: sugar ABC transporter permease [Eubacteriales bacterium]
MLRHNTKKLKSKYDKEAYAMIAPAYLIFTCFVLVPIFMVIYYSFTDFNLFEITKFVGFNNYTALFSDKYFIQAVKNTLTYSVCTLTLQLGIGLLVAVLLYRTSKWVPIFRTAFYIPNVISMVCASMVWLWLFNSNYGFFNAVLANFNLPIKQWLLDPALALPCMIAIGVWKNCGYSMVIFLSGLTGIPASLYEAADIDGAGPIRKFTAITFPMLQPTTFFLLVTGIVNSFAVFEQVNIMTAGGPLNSTTTVVHQIYRRAFSEYKMSYASAMAVVLLLFALIVTALVFKFGNKGQDTDVS